MSTTYSLINQSKVSRVSLLKLTLSLLLLSLAFQNISLITVGGAVIKPYHLITLVTLPFLLAKNRFLFIPARVLFFQILLALYLIIIFTGFVGLFSFGTISLTVNYLFCLLLFIFIIQYYLLFDNKDDYLRFCQIGASLFCFLILINAAFHYTAILKFLNNPWGHPIVETLLGGGVNLEASWFVIVGSILCTKRKYTNTVLFLSFFLAVVYASRTAFVLSVVLTLIKYFHHLKGIRTTTLIATFFLLLITFFITFTLLEDSYIIQRFSIIGEDPGSQGRLSMWVHVISLFKNNAYGYGAGNSILALEELSGYGFGESNFHNYYVQVLLDFGILGLIIYLTLCFNFFWIQKKKIFQNPFSSACILYFIACLVQFRGADSIFFFCLASWFVYLKLSLMQKKPIKCSSS